VILHSGWFWLVWVHFHPVPSRMLQGRWFGCVPSFFGCIGFLARRARLHPLVSCAFRFPRGCGRGLSRRCTMFRFAFGTWLVRFLHTSCGIASVGSPSQSARASSPSALANRTMLRRPSTLSIVCTHAWVQRFTPRRTLRSCFIASFPLLLLVPPPSRLGWLLHECNTRPGALLGLSTVVHGTTTPRAMGMAR